MSWNYWEGDRKFPKSIVDQFTIKICYCLRVFLIGAVCTCCCGFPWSFTTNERVQQMQAGGECFVVVLPCLYSFSQNEHLFLERLSFAPSPKRGSVLNCRLEYGMQTYSHHAPHMYRSTMASFGLALHFTGVGQSLCDHPPPVKLHACSGFACLFVWINANKSCQSRRGLYHLD